MIKAPYPYLSENSSWYQFCRSSGSNEPKGPLNKPLVESMTVSENIQEQIEIAGELWEMSDFEVTALCGMVADAFAEQGIKMEALV